MVLAYALLVGAPLLGVATTLRSGQSLAAPKSVAGRWTVTGPVRAWLTNQCRGLLTDAREPTIEITQSGTELSVMLTNHKRTLLRGRIDGDIVSIQAGEPSSIGCDPEALEMRATVHGVGVERFITGQLQVANCNACPPVSFQATRPGR